MEPRIDDAEVERLQMHTHTGRLLGSDSFLSKLEKLVGRPVRPLPVTRLRKTNVKR